MIGFDKSLNIKRSLLSDLLSINGNPILDFGCGTGIDSIALAQLGFNVTGYDISKEMINTANMLEAAIARAKEVGLFDIMVEDAEDPDSINDFIGTLEYVIEHFKEND